MGSPPFTAPEVWSRRLWSPAADIYSAAASVLHAMLGRLPYAGPGHRRAAHAGPADRRQGRALRPGPARRALPGGRTRPRRPARRCQSLRRGVDCGPATSSSVPGRRVVNPTVAALRGLYRHSGIGNAGNRGLDDDFADETYVQTRLDNELLPAIVRGQARRRCPVRQPRRRQDLLPGQDRRCARPRRSRRPAHATPQAGAAGWADAPSRRCTTRRSRTASCRPTSCCSTRSIRTTATIPLSARCSSPPTTAASRSSAPTTPTATRRSPPRSNGSAWAARPVPMTRVVLVDLKRRALALPDLDKLPRWAPTSSPRSPSCTAGRCAAAARCARSAPSGATPSCSAQGRRGGRCRSCC